MQREKNIIRYSITSSRTCTHTYAIQRSSEESALGRIHTCLCLLPLIQFSSLKCYCGNGRRRPPAPAPHSVMHFYSCGFSLSCFAECALYHALFISITSSSHFFPLFHFFHLHFLAPFYTAVQMFFFFPLIHIF